MSGMAEHATSRVDDAAAHEDDTPPEKVEGSVIFFAYAAIICAAVMSLTLNVYHDVRHGPHSGPFHLPGPIGVMAGVIVPLLCVCISHVAAKIPTNNWVKGWLFMLTGTLMYVSATAGTITLAPVIGLAPALAVSIGVDATAMTFLGVLMFAMTRKTAVADWHARTAERERRAVIAAVAARQSRPASRETARGNTAGALAGNAQGTTAGVSGGNGGPAPAPASLVGGTAEARPAEVPDEGEGSGLASVSPLRRPVVTDEEIRLLASALADDLALEGRPLTVRAYIGRYGGKTSRVGPIIAEVKAARENQAGPVSGAREAAR